MKFNLRLDESLFDDKMDSSIETSESGHKDIFTPDDFMEYEDYYDDHDIENVLPGPAEGADTGVASELIHLINDEWEAIQGYNNAIATLRSAINENSFYEDAIKVLEEISSEENAHVGQLQEVLRQISPNTAEINNGTIEAKSQLGLVKGRLPVQSWEEVNSSNNNLNTNEMTDICTLCDVDDEM